jgi:hypothetical protein
MVLMESQTDFQLSWRTLNSNERPVMRLNKHNEDVIIESFGEEMARPVLSFVEGIFTFEECAIPIGCEYAYFQNVLFVRDSCPFKAGERYATVLVNRKSGEMKAFVNKVDW